MEGNWMKRMQENSTAADGTGEKALWVKPALERLSLKDALSNNPSTPIDGSPDYS